MKILSSIAAVVSCAGAAPMLASAQCTAWSELSTSGPSFRSSHSMTFDSARNRTVLFGGFGPQPNGTEYFGETWELNGTTWSLRSSTGPAGRQNAALAFDSARGRTVMFGGYSAIGPVTYGQTWEWNGTTWTSPSSSGPAARYLHAMAYDAARQRTVLFGGIADGVFRDSATWTWNGSAWTQSATTGPAVRYGHAMAYDATRQRVVLFGGFGGNGTNKALLNDTWEWNGSAWTLMSSGGPTKRHNHSLAYDSSTGKVLLFGGRDANGVSLNDQWEWTGSSWTQIAVAGPDARESAAMSFDQSANRMVVFGGFSETGRMGDSWVRSSGSGSAPSIVNPPTSQSVLLGTTLILSVQAGGPGPFTYQWQRNGISLSNGGRITGALGSSLVIIGLTSGDMGSYTVRVTNACGTTTSPAAQVGVGCRADIANTSGAGIPDGGVDINDLLFFLSAFERGISAADLTNSAGNGTPDGGVDINDLLFFLARFEAGC